METIPRYAQCSGVEGEESNEKVTFSLPSEKTLEKCAKGAHRWKSTGSNGKHKNAGQRGEMRERSLIKKAFRKGALRILMKSGEQGKRQWGQVPHRTYP